MLKQCNHKVQITLSRAQFIHFLSYHLPEISLTHSHTHTVNRVNGSFEMMCASPAAQGHYPICIQWSLSIRTQWQHRLYCQTYYLWPMQPHDNRIGWFVEMEISPTYGTYRLDSTKKHIQDNHIEWVTDFRLVPPVHLLKPFSPLGGLIHLQMTSLPSKNLQ